MVEIHTSLWGTQKTFSYKIVISNKVNDREQFEHTCRSRDKVSATRADSMVEKESKQQQQVLKRR